MQGVVLQAVVGCTLGGLLWMGVALRRWGQGFAWEGGCMKVRLSQVGVCCRSLLVLLGGGAAVAGSGRCWISQLLFLFPWVQRAGLWGYWALAVPRSTGSLARGRGALEATCCCLLLLLQHLHQAILCGACSRLLLLCFLLLLLLLLLCLLFLFLLACFRCCRRSTRSLAGGLRCCELLLLFGGMQSCLIGFRYGFLLLLLLQRSICLTLPLQLSPASQKCSFCRRNSHPLGPFN